MTRRLQFLLCCLGSLLLGSPALGQQDPRAVIVRPSTAEKAGGVRAPRARAPREAPAAKRYWADYAGKAIRRSNLDGSNVETVSSEVEGPYGTSYDPETGYVLWTSAGDEVVQMAPANGFGETITLNTSFEDHFAVTVSGSEYEVAYGVVDGQVIRVTQNRNTGAEQRDVLHTLTSPDQVHGLSLTPDSTALYLGDEAGRMTQKLNLSTLQVTQLVYDNAESAVAPAPESPAKEPAPATRSRPSAPASKSRPSSTEKTR